LQDRTKGWKKHDGSIRESKRVEATIFVLDDILARCQDFATEITHLEHVVEQIADNLDIKVALVHSVKYHCECAGLGVEYCFGFEKRYHRRATSPGYKKRDFRGSVREGTEQVTKDHT
jgi:sigma54-dependent transcription regulator